MSKLIQRMCIDVTILALMVLFIVMGWWIALVIEVAVLIIVIVGISFFMVNFTLKRRTPISMGKVIGLEENSKLNDYVKEAVLWLETGELWEETSYDGLMLRGRFLKNEGSHIYAICCHGYTNHRLQDISNPARMFYERGYNVFAGYARGHGRSEGAYLGMGCKERRDIVAWVNRIVKMDPEARIFLYGVSMGASTVMNASGESDLADNVKCVIEDCGYSSVWKEFREQLGNRFGVPVVPILNLCELISIIRYGFGFHEHSALLQVKNARIPMLFIHGDKDTFVPYEMMEPLYEACGSEDKKKLTIIGAEHAEAYQVDPETYWAGVDEWLEAYL